MTWPLLAIAASSLLGSSPVNHTKTAAESKSSAPESKPLASLWLEKPSKNVSSGPHALAASKEAVIQGGLQFKPTKDPPVLPPGVFLVATTPQPMTNTQYWISMTVPPAPTTPPPPPTKAPEEPKLDKASAEQIKAEIVALRNEVKTSNEEMWKAAKLISQTVDADEKKMKTITNDISTLRGRAGGLTPRVSTECSARQASCTECTSVPTCVWCGVEQKCYSGDASGPLRGECTFYKHGLC